MATASTLDSSKLRVGVLLEQRSEEALDFTHTLTGSPFIDATISDNRQQLIQMMQAGRIRGLVVVPVNFDAQMARPGDTAPIQVITDGSEPNTANFVQGYLQDLATLAAATGGRSRRNLRIVDRHSDALLV